MSHSWRCDRKAGYYAFADTSLLDSGVVRRGIQSSRFDYGPPASPDHHGLFRLVDIRSTLLGIDPGDGGRPGITWHCYRYLESFR